MSLHIAKGVHGVNKLHIQAPNNPCQRLLVFLAGDRVDFHGCDPVIQELQDPRQICAILSAKAGPDTTVALVLPSHYEACCAVYHHFFEKLTLTGEPLGYSGRTFKASEQLHSLLEAAGVALPTSIDLVGFSKGAVVLNQLLAELAVFAAAPPDAPLPASAPLLRSLRRFHYLDAGLNCRGAYLTDPEAVVRLGAWATQQSGFGITLHGTPRQWGDFSRPWIRAERDRLAALCRESGVPVDVREYFQGQKPSIKMHFEVIKEFQL